MKHVRMLTLSLCLAMGTSVQATAQMQSPTKTQTQATEQAQDRVYGSELMTPQERNEYQNRMRAAKTDQEREAIRLEHHKQMQARAKAQGKTLPDMPPAGMGPGGGMGAGGGKGMGPGGKAY